MKDFTELIKRVGKDKPALLLGVEMIFIGHGTATFKMPIKEEFIIPEGFVHGGLIITLADFAGGYAAMTRADAVHTPTLRLEASFYRPIKAEDGEVIVRAMVDNESKNHIWVTINIFSPHRRIKGKVTAIYVKKSTNP